MIKNRDRAHALFYVDPPYAGTEQGYGVQEFGADDLQRLCDTLAEVKGRFVMSGFPHPVLEEAIERHGWHCAEVRKRYCMQTTDPAKKGGKRELLVANYAFTLKEKKTKAKNDGKGDCKEHSGGCPADAKPGGSAVHGGSR